MAALHTGHNWRVGRVSSHWCKHGQQNKCPHILTTASLAVSKQILHSNIESSFFVPLDSPLSPDFASVSEKLFVFNGSVLFDVVAASDVPVKPPFEFVLKSVPALSVLLCELDDGDDTGGAAVDVVVVSNDEDILLLLLVLMLYWLEFYFRCSILSHLIFPLWYMWTSSCNINDSINKNHCFRSMQLVIDCNENWNMYTRWVGSVCKQLTLSVDNLFELLRQCEKKHTQK